MGGENDGNAYRANTWLIPANSGLFPFISAHSKQALLRGTCGPGIGATVVSEGGVTESTVEAAALAWLESSGWRIRNGAEIAPGESAAERDDYRQVVLAQRLREALARLNPALSPDALEDAFRKLSRPEGSDLIAQNRVTHRLIVDGVPLEYRDVSGDIRGTQVQVIDFDHAAENDWLAVNQFSVVENGHARRADIVLFVNGLPLAVLELKNAADEGATIWTAFRQLQTYKAEIPSLFAANAVLVVSDGVEARVGTIGSGREWFKPWRTVTGEALADPHLPELQVMIEGMFENRPLPRSRPCTSSSSRTMAAVMSPRRWRATTSSMRFSVAIERDAAGRRAATAGSMEWRTWARSRPGEDRAASPATGASAWSGTRRARARA